MGYWHKLVGLFLFTEDAMKREIMICGIDCNPGDGVCNNYCNCDTSKPMADSPPEAPKHVVYARLIERAKAACDKADAAVEEVRLAHNELFADGIVAGLQAMADSCERRREKLKLMSGDRA